MQRVVEHVAGREADSGVWPVLSEAVEALEEAWRQYPRPDLAMMRTSGEPLLLDFGLAAFE